MPCCSEKYVGDYYRRHLYDYEYLRVRCQNKMAVHCAGRIPPALAVKEKPPRVRFNARDHRLASERGT